MTVIVLDTNVFISAFVFGGNPRLIVQLAENGAYSLAISRAIRTETEHVLMDKFGWTRDRVLHACEPVWKVGKMVAPRVEINAARDAEDNRILECAVEASAAAVVTGDWDLLQLDPFNAIRIVTPAEFLQRRMWVARRK